MQTQSYNKLLSVYLILSLLITFSASFIWGVNTLFLLDAGLSNTQAFTANAFFTVGMVIFEIPTGIVADTWGRRTSLLLGAVTLIVGTILYMILWYFKGDFYLWALSSLILGLGYTFFSGAVEAWIVDAMNFVGYKGSIDTVFSKSQIVNGAAMLSGSVIGGIVAQQYNLGVPYLLRAIMLIFTFVFAFIFMKELGFEKRKISKPIKEMKLIFDASLVHGLGNRPIRWMMFGAPFTMGAGIFAFYAMQPYLLELYGNTQAYSVAGLAAAIVAGAQILGGILAPKVLKLFKYRTSILAIGGVLGSITMLMIAVVSNFYLAVLLLIIWAMSFAAVTPVRQAYLNGLIPAKQRATVLSFDSLMASSGGIVTQPALGKTADVYGYSSAYLICAAVQVLTLPFMLLAKAEKAPSDSISN